MNATIVNFYVRSGNSAQLEEMMQQWCQEHKVTDGPTERHGRAVITPAVAGWSVVYDEAVESDDALIHPLAVRVSAELAAEVVAVVVYDDEVLTYTVYDDTGRVVDDYWSEPDRRPPLDSRDEDGFGLEAAEYGDALGGYDDDASGDHGAAPGARFDPKLLEELSSNPMADAEMFQLLLDPSEHGLAFTEELLEEFSTLLGIEERYIGLGYRDWVQFLDDPTTGSGVIHVTI